MPFESKGAYRDLLIAYVAALCGLGCTPWTVLQIEQTTDRLTRLKKSIQRCGSSIHDLSCVVRRGGAPRFNMPFELGLAASVPKHKWFILEAERFRIQRTLSDVNGYDPLIHAMNPQKAIANVASVFRNTKRDTTVAELRRVYVAAQKVAKDIEKEYDSLINGRAFEELVLGCQDIARKLGLI